MELGRWFKKWVDEDSGGWESDDNPEAAGWLDVRLKVDTLTVTYEPVNEDGEPSGVNQAEYYRVTRIAEPPTSIPTT